MKTEEETVKEYVAKVLIEMKNILSDESKWCQDHSAVTVNGKEVDPNHVHAKKWCLSGAECRAKHHLGLFDPEMSIRFHIRHLMADVINSYIEEHNVTLIRNHDDYDTYEKSFMATFNDSRQIRYSDVVNVLDLCIAANK